MKKLFIALILLSLTGCANLKKHELGHAFDGMTNQKHATCTTFNNTTDCTY